MNGGCTTTIKKSNGCCKRTFLNRQKSWKKQSRSSLMSIESDKNIPEVDSLGIFLCSARSLHPISLENNLAVTLYPSGFGHALRPLEHKIRTPIYNPESELVCWFDLLINFIPEIQGLVCYGVWNRTEPVMPDFHKELRNFHVRSRP